MLRATSAKKGLECSRHLQRAYLPRSLTQRVCLESLHVSLMSVLGYGLIDATSEIGAVLAQPAFESVALIKDFVRT